MTTDGDRRQTDERRPTTDDRRPPAPPPAPLLIAFACPLANTVALQVRRNRCKDCVHRGRLSMAVRNKVSVDPGRLQGGCNGGLPAAQGCFSQGSPARSCASPWAPHAPGVTRQAAWTSATHAVSKSPTDTMVWHCARRAEANCSPAAAHGSCIHAGRCGAGRATEGDAGPAPPLSQCPQWGSPGRKRSDRRPRATARHGSPGPDAMPDLGRARGRLGGPEIHLNCGRQLRHRVPSRLLVEMPTATHAQAAAPPPPTAAQSGGPYTTNTRTVAPEGKVQST